MPCSWSISWSIWCSRGSYGRRGSGRCGRGRRRRRPSAPEGLQALLLRRIEALAPEARRVLEAASVVGEAFAVAAVAAGVQGSIEDVEAVCDGLATRGTSSTTLGGRSGGWHPRWTYRFQHALYRQVLYERLGTMRCVQLHGRIGARLEGGYGAQAGRSPPSSPCTSSAPEARSAGRALLAADGGDGGGRHAYPEALTALRKGLTLLATLPESPTRMQDELTLLLSLGELLIAARAWRRRTWVTCTCTCRPRLCHRLGEPPQRFQVLQGLCLFHLNQAQLSAASALAQELTDLAHRQREAGPVLTGQATMGTVALFRGDFVAARATWSTIARAVTPITLCPHLVC